MSNKRQCILRGTAAMCMLGPLTCGEDRAWTLPPQGLASVGDTIDLQDEALRSLTIGKADDPTGLRIFGSVVDAALLPDAGVVVLDRDAPYVRVFDSRGELKAAFLRNGGGPGEARSPVDVAVRDADRSILVVHDNDIISRFTADGEYLGRARPVEGRIRGALPVCNGGRSVFVYGGNGADAFAGIFSEVDESFTPITIDAVSRTYLPRHPLFMARDGDGVFFFNERGDPPSLQHWRCGATSTTTVRDSLVRDAAPRTLSARPTTASEATGPGLRVRIGAGAPPYPAGLAATANGYVWLERLGRQPDDWDERSTRLFAADLGHDEPLVVFPGWYWLHDYRPDVGFLFSAAGPTVPEVFVVPPGGLPPVGGH